jgi:cytochrome c-type biogenesis protein
MTTHAAKPGGWWLYALLLALLIFIIFGGYTLFRVFVSTIMPDLSAYNFLTLAVIAGIASFFSPCAFPLLPGYLSFYYTGVGDTAEGSETKHRVIALGIAAALGVVTFNLALGVVIGLLGAAVAQGLSISGSQPNPFVRAFRAGVGITLMALGTAQLTGVNLKPVLADALAWRVRPRQDAASRNPILRLYLYGLGYNAAGMGCTGPILAGLVIYALAAGGFAAALSAFILFSATMGGLMLLVSLLVATSQDTLIRRLKAATPHIKTASSLLLIGVGLFNVVSAFDVGTFVRLLFP